MNLYDLLSETEVASVKQNTSVRNVPLNDLTVSELTDLFDCITCLEMRYRSPLLMGVRVLQELKIRSFAHVAHPQQSVKAVAGLFSYPETKHVPPVDIIETKDPKLP